MVDVVVIGAGPAGIAAAIAAAEAGAQTTLIDDNPAMGGQIWREACGKAPDGKVQRLYRRIEELGVKFRPGCIVVDVGPGKTLLLDEDDGPETIKFDCAVLATGARELFLPFPGWTLPGVMGAGGAQALLKGGANVEGKRVVVSGSGPLLFAVGASFAAAGGDVVGVFEQAPLSKLFRFGLKALHLKRMVEAAGYLAKLGSTPYCAGTWVTAAHGGDALDTVVITDGTRSWTEPCDLLACAYGLVPNTELAEIIGCEITDGCVKVNGSQETTVEGVFAAGEPLGIGGLDLALAEGTVAGSTAAGKEDQRASATASRLKSFRKLLAESFDLRPELLRLGDAETILCRCEDVRLGVIDSAWSARQAKLYTRIGMGPCQGRICGPTARCLFGWSPDRARPPLYPTGVNHLAARTTAETL